jgi:hypothetical protein
LTSAPAQCAAYDRDTLGERLQFGKGEIARDVFHAAIGRRDQLLRRQVRERRTDAGGDGLGCLGLGAAALPWSGYVIGLHQDNA